VTELNLLRKPLRSLFGGKPSEGAPSAPAGANGGATEVALQHLWTEQPNALKFLVGTTLLPFGEQRRYDNREAAEESPLAQAIFEAGGIAAIALDGNTITVEMEEDADWDGLMKRVPDMMRKFFAAGGTPMRSAAPTGTAPSSESGAGDASKRYKFGFRQVEGRAREEQIRIVQELFDKEVNPAVSAHGGYFTLLDVQDNNVYVELGGGCQGCGMANVTLRQGVEERLREVLPEMVDLIDQTDHASGSNPYYQASKK